MMNLPDEIIFSHVVDVLAKHTEHGETKPAIFTIILGTPEGKRAQYSLTTNAADALVLMLSNRLKSLTSPVEAELE
jgi:hypothetical protein